MNSVTPIRPSRTLPNNQRFEASILGAVILKPEALADLADLETDDFYHFPHRVVWEGIRNLEAAQKPIDVVTLDDEIRKSGRIDAIGGIAFLGELALLVPTAENVIAYRDDVRLLARNRKAIIALSSAVERAYNWQHEPLELVEEVGAELARIELTAPGKRERVKLTDVGMALQELDSLANAPVYDTPFPTLNRALGHGGMLGTQCYTLAAGTGRGKTSFVAQLAFHTAMQDIPVLVVSYEMKPGYFVARKASGLLGVHSNDILRGRIDSGLIMRAMPAHRLFMLHKPPLKDVRNAVDQLAQKFGTPPLLVVDYLQKLADQISRTQARPDLRIATSEASDTLVDIGDRTGAAVVAVSAIGRGNNKRAANPRKLEPYELVDVSKESGNVEYDGAGLIMLSLSKDFDGEERIGTITVAKARFGMEVHIDARYDGPRGSWRDLGEVTEGYDEPSTEPKPKENLIRAAILSVLRTYGPQPSKSKIVTISKRNKTSVFREIDALIDDRIVVHADGAFRLYEPAPDVVQPTLTGVS